MSLLFCSVNLKGVFALFSGESLCCNQGYQCLQSWMVEFWGDRETYNLESVARKSCAGRKRSVL